MEVTKLRDELVIVSDACNTNPRYVELRTFMDRYLDGELTANQWVHDNIDEFRIIQQELQTLEGPMKELRQAISSEEFLATIS